MFISFSTKTKLLAPLDRSELLGLGIAEVRSRPLQTNSRFGFSRDPRRNDGLRGSAIEQAAGAQAHIRRANTNASCIENAHCHVSNTTLTIVPRLPSWQLDEPRCRITQFSFVSYCIRETETTGR